MNEKPKSIWKKSWTGLRAWLMVVAATFFIVLIVTLLIPGGFRNFSWWPALIFTLVVSVVTAVCAGLLAFIRCFFCWRKFKRLLFGLACLVTLIALAYAEEDWRGWHAWNQFKHEWEAKGEKFDYASIVPPPVPDDQNFALTPIVASCYEHYFDKNGHELIPRNTNVVDRLSMITWRDNHWAHIPESDNDHRDWRLSKKSDLKAWQEYFRSPPPTNSVETNSFPIAPQPQSPADDILLALSIYDSVIEEIRQASRLSYSRFPLTYNSEGAFSILLPHLAALKTSEQAVRLRSVAELQKNQTELAVEDVRLGLYLANAIRTEPFLISQLVRLSMLEIALQPVWEGLADHRWSEPQLVTLDEELVKLDFMADCQNVQRSEIFFPAQEANYLRRHRDYATQFAQMGFRYPIDARFKFAIYRYMPGGWFYQSALKNGRTLMQYLPAVNHDTKTISPALIRRADAAANNAVSFFDPLDSLKKMFNEEFQFMGNFVKKIAEGQSSVDLARVAIALERYRLAHNEYPESLDALAPQFIEKVPHDIIGGQPSQGSGSASQPLHYRRTSDGQFVLYSVGWNETDDGGVVGLTKGGAVDNNKGDWVWRYPEK